MSRTAPRAAIRQRPEVYNVIDSRQSYLQDVVVAGLRALGFDEQADNSIHFSYEMVALSPRCCADLGIELSAEDASRPYVEVSGRKGLGVKADDLMDKLVETALREVVSRHPEDNEAAQLAVATEIAMGALRYFLLKFTRNTVIAFDFQEALSFEGETGPYVQYAAVRARNIFRKLEERGEAMPDFNAELTREAMARQLAIGRTLADPDRGGQGGFGGGTCGRCRGTGARRQIRVSACADVQPLLSSISGAGRAGCRAQSIPALDDRVLPRATGANAFGAGDCRSGLHVISLLRYIYASRT